jgi:hypothetical protein
MVIRKFSLVACSLAKAQQAARPLDACFALCQS